VRVGITFEAVFGMFSAAAEDGGREGRGVDDI